MNNSTKTLIQKLAVISVLIITSLAALSETPPVSSARFTVNGMVCAFCAQGIEKKLSDIPETKAVYISLADKFVVVEPKEGKTLDTALITTEIKDAGYDVIKVETVTGSVADIRKAMESKK